MSAADDLPRISPAPGGGRLVERRRLPRMAVHSDADSRAAELRPQRDGVNLRLSCPHEGCAAEILIDATRLRNWDRFRCEACGDIVTVRHGDEIATAAMVLRSTLGIARDTLVTAGTSARFEALGGQVLISASDPRDPSS